MEKKIILKLLFYGLLSWLIPFVVSFLFYKPTGELMVEYATFKTSIMLVGNISGCFLLFKYFKLISNDFIKHALIVGFSWFAINIILDAIILIPMMKSTFSNYFMTIGLGYFAILAMSLMIGFLLKSKVNYHE